MTPIAALWLPILLSAIIVFIASSIIHMAVPDQDLVMDALRPFKPQPGEYMLPRAKNGKESQEPEFVEKLKRGPVLIMTVIPKCASRTAKNALTGSGFPIPGGCARLKNREGNSMKCLYYVAPELESTAQVSEDLHDVGIDDFFVHVIAKDESGLKKRHIHTGNYLETLDFIREGFLGAAIGLFAGVIGCVLLDQFGPFPNIPWFVFVALCAVATLFGAWEGGLIGVEKENKKLERFHDDIEAGRYLILIYARRDQESVVRHMMKRRHPEAEFEGVDSHFVNPFTAVRRRRKSGDRVRA